jgi:ribosomal protein S18 acetylase RimI-like enzyme
MLDRMYGPEAILADMEAGTHYQVFYAEGTPAGYLAFGLDPGPTLRLDKLYLRARFRGRGLGQRMLEHVRNEAGRRGAREITLRVNKRNAAALAAYGRFGFERIGELTEDIGGGYVMDDYVLRLVTSPPAPR